MDSEDSFISSSTHGNQSSSPEGNQTRFDTRRNPQIAKPSVLVPGHRLMVKRSIASPVKKTQSSNLPKQSAHKDVPVSPFNYDETKPAQTDQNRMSFKGLGIKDSSSDCTDFTEDTETPDNHPDNVRETSANRTLDTANETTWVASEGHIGLDLFSDLSSDGPEPEIVCTPGDRLAEEQKTESAPSDVFNTTEVSREDIKAVASGGHIYPDLANFVISTEQPRSEDSGYRLLSPSCHKKESEEIDMRGISDSSNRSLSGPDAGSIHELEGVLNQAEMQEEFHILQGNAAWGSSVDEADHASEVADVFVSTMDDVEAQLEKQKNIDDELKTLLTKICEWMKRSASGDQIQQLADRCAYRPPIKELGAFRDRLDVLNLSQEELRNERKDLIDAVTGRIDEAISKMDGEFDIQESFRGLASQLDADNREPSSTSRPSKERHDDPLKSEEIILESMREEERALNAKIQRHVETIRSLREQENVLNSANHESLARLKSSGCRIGKHVRNSLGETRSLLEGIKSTFVETKSNLGRIFSDASIEITVLVDEATSDMRSLKQQFTEILKSIMDKRKALLKKEQEIDKAVHLERSLIESEFDEKERLFQQYCRQREEELSFQASDLRKEVIRWTEIKDHLAKREGDLVLSAQKLQEISKRQQTERKWLCQRREEIKIDIQENNRLAKLIKRDVERKRTLYEMCEISKKQIEMTIQFHKERGGVVQAVYWNPKKCKVHFGECQIDKENGNSTFLI